MVDGAGAMLCPGFIDLHAHSALESFDDPLLAPKLLQGFTTEVINPDGLAPAPVRRAGLAARRAYLRALEGEGPEEWPWESLSEYLDCLDATRPALTLVPSIGHGAVREVVLGSEPGVPSAGAARRDAARGSARARGGGADAVVRARLHPRRLRRHGRARRGRPRGGRVRSAARPARPQRGRRAARGGRGDGRRRAAVGRVASPLASEGALGRRARRAAARADRRRRRRDRRDLRPVPLRRRRDAAREPAAGVGAGRRGRGDARAGRGSRGAPGDRARRPRRAPGLGEPARDARRRSGSSSAADARRSEAATRSTRSATSCSRATSRRR